MKEYIERDSVLKAIKEPYERVYGKCVYKPVEDVYRMIVKRINNSHAADVAPVVHGAWSLENDEEMPNFMFKLVICSACGEKANHTYNYCPNCGAKMDEKLTSTKLSRCRKCIHEVTCDKDKDYEGKCPNYKRDAPDGGYYG